MIQNFVFKEKTMFKKDLYAFMCELLESNGWTKLSKGRAADNEVYSSKGTSGKDNIIFQMQPYYSTTKANTISNSNVSSFGVRPIHTYTPHANLTSAGSVLPNKEYNWFYAFYNTFPPEGKITVGYHCNADRLILIITLDPAISGKSSLLAIGKLNPLVELNEFSQTTMFAVPTYSVSAGRAASLPYYDHSNSYELTVHSAFGTGSSIPRGISASGMRQASEVVLWSSVLGAYAKLDNVIILPNTIVSVLNPDISKDTLKDPDGYTWRLCASQTVYNGFPTNYFAYRIG